MSCLTIRCKIQQQCARYASNIRPLPKIQSVNSKAPSDGSIVNKPEDCENFVEFTDE